MDAAGLLLQAAFDRLYRWSKDTMHACLRDPSPDPPDLLPVAIAALRHRPVLLEYCVADVKELRSSTVFRSFLDALVHGSPSGVPRPIEIHAHDPVRYVGDMLAWVHQVQLKLCYALSITLHRYPTRPFIFHSVLHHSCSTLRSSTPAALTSR